MSERYTRLFALPENQYAPSAPILIAAGALLKDNQTGKVLAQFKFQSISPKEIKAVKISVTAFDVFGKEVKGVAEYQYLDLSASRDAEFGQKQAVPLPDAVTHTIGVECTSVVFEDGSVWEAPKNAQWIEHYQASRHRGQRKNRDGNRCPLPTGFIEGATQSQSSETRLLRNAQLPQFQNALLLYIKVVPEIFPAL